MISTNKDAIRAYIKKTVQTKNAANDNHRTQVILKTSYRPKQGRGAWTAITNNGFTETIFSGHVGKSTNHRIEITAAIETLSRFKNGERIILYSSLKPFINTINIYFHEWKANGWLNSDGKKPQNLDLWLKLFNQYKRLRVKWVYKPAAELNHEHPILATLLQTQHDHITRVA